MTGLKDPASPSPPLGPSPRPPPSRTHKARGVVTMEQASILPDLRKSDDLLKKPEPLPTSLQADFLPDSILKALIQPAPPPEQLGPSSRHRNLNVSTIPNRRPAANVFGFPQRREKVKHLTDKIPCVCGAGKDISFLYDVPKKEKPRKIDENDQSSIRLQEEAEPRKTIQLPDTLIPEEYHIVKNKGVLGLEYIEDEFATQPQDHDKHLVTFPSLNPTSRHEVKQLKRTMQDMLQRMGINDLATELKGPTQMHNLIELIKKEQNIYNIVFHELIRQVSVECLDRGELLSILRDQYSELLNRVPLQIKGLHEEVMAQRALDRRLTEELMRFKSTIGVLTSELSYVKEHDVEVSAQATQAQDDLKLALSESQKNASLLSEYHDLYELQRRRLENQVLMLAEEKELWSTAAYSLALKVTEEHSLNTAKRLHISEKAWAKLANHFTILLSDKDTVKLTSLQEYVDQWRDLVEDFNANTRVREDEMKKTLTDVQEALRGWKATFNKHVMNKEGHVMKGLNRERAANLYSDIKNWGQLFNQEGEKFGGDTLLGGQESLMKIRRQVEGWTDCALKVFTRHRGEDGSNYPDHNEMLKMNEMVDDLMSQYYVRLTGENGVATGLIHVTNGLDMWDGKLNAMMHGSNSLPDHEWGRIRALFDEWIDSIENTKDLIGTTQKEDDRNAKRSHEKIELNAVMKMTQKWLSSATNGIDSEDAKLVEQVNTLHTEMVKWMVQLLLRLAPDQASHSQEAKDAVLEGTTSMAQLVANAKSLFHRLAGFSKYVAMCCNGIVMDLMQEKIDRHEEAADHEYRDLQRLKNECDDWIGTAKLLLAELTGEPFPDTPAPSVMDMAPSVTEGLKSREQTEDSLLLHAEDMDDIEPSEGQPEGIDEPPSEVQAPEETQAKSDDEPPPPAATQESVAPAADAQKTEPESSQLETGQSGEDKAQDQVIGEGEAPEQDQEEKEPAPAGQKDENLRVQIIGHDANTRSRIFPEQPKSAAPIDTRPVTTPGTPDPRKAFEAIAALEALQDQLISTEERALTAEERAANAEAELKKALERITSLERKVAVTPSGSEGAERPESVTAEASTVKSSDKVEKEKSKVTKEKEKRPSSKASNKPKKK